MPLLLPPLLLRPLDPTQLANGWWRLGQVMLSRLGPHPKALLLLLLRLDPVGLGVQVGWDDLAAATSLSPSSVRRAADHLGLLGLLTSQPQKGTDGQLLANTFFHQLVNPQHPLLVNPADPFYDHDQLTHFLAARQAFEDALASLLLSLSPKGSRAKRQGRDHDHAPRPWRQTYPPNSPLGHALLQLATFQYPEHKDDLSKNMARMVDGYARSCRPPLEAKQVALITPQHCLGWVHRRTQAPGQAAR